MREFIGRVCAIMFSPRGRHRTTAPAASPSPVRSPQPCHFPPMDGDAVPIGRPYVPAHERCVEQHGQRELRRALALATVGVDYAGVAW